MNARTASRLSALAICAGLLASAFAASSNRAGAADQPPIVIGTTVSQTGAYAEDAKYALEGYQLWVKDQNAKGGLLGRKIELKYYDDASDPATALTQFQKLVQQDHVNIVVGPYSSAITAAVANIPEQYKMPMISPEVSSVAPFKRGLKWIFQGQSQSTRYVAGALDIARTNGYKRIALTGEDTAFPRSVAVAIPDLAKAAGLEVVFNELYPHNASDYTAIAQKIKQANPDVILGISYFPDSIGLLRAFKQANVTPKELFFAVGPTEPNFGKEAGRDADGVLSTSNWSANLKTANNAAFTKSFQEMFHTNPDYHSAANYAGLEVLAAAINSAKSLDNEKIRAFMSTQKVQTVMGTYEVDPNNIQVGYDSLTMQWQGGKQYLVWPAKFAERRPQVPFPSWAK